MGRRIEVTLQNKVYDGKRQWLYFLILDLNDFFQIANFTIGNNCVFKNFKIDDIEKYPVKSSKFLLIQSVWREIGRNTILELVLSP